MKIHPHGTSSKSFDAIGIMPFRWLILLVISLLSTATAGYCQTAAANTLGLSRQAAVAMAVRRNIDLKSEALDKAIAKAALDRSKGIYDPFLSASLNTQARSFPEDDFKTKRTDAAIAVNKLVPTGANIGAFTQSGFSSIESPSARSFERDWQSTVGVTVSQPLLKDFGKETTELNITLAANSYQGSLEFYRSFIIDTVFLVITSYDRLYKLREILKERETALTSALKFRDEVKETAKQRAIGKTEIANAEYAIYQRRKDLVDASREVKDEEESLRFLIGMEEKQELIPLDPPSREEPAESQEEAVKIALAERSDLKQLQLALAASELQERVSKRQTLPNLSLELSGDFSGLNSGGGGSYEQIARTEAGAWEAGLLFSVPLGNTTARNDYLANKLRTEQVRHQIASFSWRIRNDVEEDMRALISARLQVQLADKSREIGEIRLAEYRKNLRAGLSTVQDVIDSENDLIFAQISQLEATETFASSVARLRRNMGTLLNHYNIHVETSTPTKETGKGTPSEDSPKTAPPAGGSGVGSGGAAPSRQHQPSAEPAPPSGSVKGVPPAQGQALDRQETTSKATDLRGEKDNPAPMPGGKTAERPEVRAMSGKYTLQVGEFTTRSALAEAKAKIESVGLPSVVKEGPKRKIPMIRLVVGDFPTKKAASKELDKLRNVKTTGFILLDDEHTYSVFAGSFFSKEKAVKEQKRLARLGIALRLRNAFVDLPTYHLSAGNFPTRQAALTEAVRLEKKGVSSIVLENS